MKPARIIHALTDLCLAVLVGTSVGTSVAAATIFGVSREQGFPKHIANTLAGTMFDRLGWPMLILALLATLGCLYAIKKPAVTGLVTPRTRLAWKLMGAAAVLMLADSVESASRTLVEPTSSRIQNLVDQIAMKKLLDGQFDQCGLTLQQLDQLKSSLVKSLTAIYHGRVKYTGQASA